MLLALEAGRIVSAAVHSAGAVVGAGVISLLKNQCLNGCLADASGKRGGDISPPKHICGPPAAAPAPGEVLASYTSD